MSGVRGGGKPAPLRHQETIGSNTECGVMVKSAPAAAFKMSQPEFLFQFLIVAFDEPALFGQCDQIRQKEVFPQIGQPVRARFGLAARPFDQEPVLLAWLAELVVPVRDADAHTGETSSIPPKRRPSAANCEPSPTSVFGDTASSRIRRISASVLRLLRAGRSFRARCVSSESFRTVTADIWLSLSACHR